jgi:hypothetical protein
MSMLVIRISFAFMSHFHPGPVVVKASYYRRKSFVLSPQILRISIVNPSQSVGNSSYPLRKHIEIHSSGGSQICRVPFAIPSYYVFVNPSYTHKNLAANLLFHS